MELSLIVPTRNRPDVLRRMLRSLEAAKPLPWQWELLVIDNNSVSELLPQNRDIIKQASLPVRLLCERTPGKSAALNTGIKQAKGKIAAFLDDDIVVHEDYFVGIVEATTKLPGRAFGG